MLVFSYTMILQIAFTLLFCLFTLHCSEGNDRRDIKADRRIFNFFNRGPNKNLHRFMKNTSFNKKFKLPRPFRRPKPIHYQPLQHRPSSSYKPPPYAPHNTYGPPQPLNTGYIHTVPKLPSSGYAVPEQPSSGYAVPEQPSSGYTVPEQPSNGYNPPSKIPSSNYGAPAEPQNEYGPPSESNTNEPSDSPKSHFDIISSKPSSNSYNLPKLPTNDYNFVEKPTNDYNPPKDHSSLIDESYDGTQDFGPPKEQDQLTYNNPSSNEYEEQQLPPVQSYSTYISEDAEAYLPLDSTFLRPETYDQISHEAPGFHETGFSAPKPHDISNSVTFSDSSSHLNENSHYSSETLDSTENLDYQPHSQNSLSTPLTNSVIDSNTYSSNSFDFNKQQNFESELPFSQIKDTHKQLQHVDVDGPYDHQNIISQVSSATDDKDSDIIYGNTANQVPPPIYFENNDDLSGPESNFGNSFYLNEGSQQPNVPQLDKNLKNNLPPSGSSSLDIDFYREPQPPTAYQRPNIAANSIYTSNVNDADEHLSSDYDSTSDVIASYIEANHKNVYSSSSASNEDTNLPSAYRPPLKSFQITKANLMSKNPVAAPVPLKPIFELYDYQASQRNENDKHLTGKIHPSENHHFVENISNGINFNVPDSPEINIEIYDANESDNSLKDLSTELPGPGGSDTIYISSPSIRHSGDQSTEILTPDTSLEGSTDDIILPQKEFKTIYRNDVIPITNPLVIASSSRELQRKRIKNTNRELETSKLENMNFEPLKLNVVASKFI